MKAFEDYIDEVYGVTEDSADQNDRALGSHTVVYEITINYPAPELYLLEHIQTYKDLWAQIKSEYDSYNDYYVIEYCKTGQPHLHGYMSMDYNIKTMAFEDELFLEALFKSILKKLPKKLFKMNMNKRIYNPGFRRLKSPAICLNMKNLLSHNWENYIEKTRVQN